MSADREGRLVVVALGKLSWSAVVAETCHDRGSLGKTDLAHKPASWAHAAMEEEGSKRTSWPLNIRLIGC